MRLDWTDLRVFLHACETGSMTQAARRAHLTLAAVSARLRDLEAATGVPLLRRHARGVAPTPAGEALARHALVVLRQLDTLRRDIAPGAPPPADLVLLANSSALARPLYPVLAAFLAAHPHAQLSVRESGSEVTVHALHAGTADVGVVTDAAATAGLVAEDLGADPLVLLAAPAHPLASQGPPSFRQALAHDWVGWGEDGALHTHLVMQAGRAGAALKTVASVPSAAGVVELVAQGIGVSVLPLALLARLDPGRRVRALPLAEAWAQRRLLLCRRADPGAAVPLFQALKEHWAAVDAEFQRQGLSPCPSAASAPARAPG